MSIPAATSSRGNDSGPHTPHERALAHERAGDFGGSFFEHLNAIWMLDENASAETAQDVTLSAAAFMLTGFVDGGMPQVQDSFARYADLPAWCDLRMTFAIAECFAAPSALGWIATLEQAYGESEESAFWKSILPFVDCRPPLLNCQDVNTPGCREHWSRLLARYPSSPWIRAGMIAFAGAPWDEGLYRHFFDLASRHKITRYREVAGFLIWRTIYDSSFEEDLGNRLLGDLNSATGSSCWCDRRG